MAENAEQKSVLYCFLQTHVSNFLKPYKTKQKKKKREREQVYLMAVLLQETQDAPLGTYIDDMWVEVGR